MKKIKILCDGISDINPIATGKMEVEIEEPNLMFLDDVPVGAILSYHDNMELLEKIIENDPQILTDFFKKKNLDRFAKTTIRG